MLKWQSKLQKIIFPLAVIVFGLAFLYALSYATPYGDFILVDGTGVPEIQEAYELFLSIQGFIWEMIAFAVIGCLLGGCLFVYRCQLRKKYYITNFVVCFLYAAFAIFTACFFFFNIMQDQAAYNSLDFTAINEELDFLGGQLVSAGTASVSFILGYILSTLILIIGVGVAFVGVSKIITNKNAISETPVEEGK